jgi:carboxymethylenebutenolidase
MHERFIDIKTAEGAMETFVTHPEENGPFPAVIIYMDIWGVREELYDIARRVGTVGYYCMVPDFYYRNGKRVHFEFRNANNQTISINRLAGQALVEIQARPKLSNKMVLDDTGAILKFLDGAEQVRRGGVGAIGFCMGGRYVMGAAGTYPEHFVASASLHGTTLISDRDDSPHLLAANLRGEFYCGFAEHDPHAPLTMVQELEQILEPCRVGYRFTVHPGTEHGYSLPDRDVHDKRSTARDWELIFAMLQRQIPPYIA